MVQYLCVCDVVTVATVMLLRDFWSYWIIFITMYVFYFRFFSVILDRQFTSLIKNQNKMFPR
jgi:hypothetical protein